MRQVWGAALMIGVATLGVPAAADHSGKLVWQDGVPRVIPNRHDRYDRYNDLLPDEEIEPLDPLDPERPNPFPRQNTFNSTNPGASGAGVAVPGVPPTDLTRGNSPQVYGPSFTSGGPKPGSSPRGVTFGGPPVRSIGADF